MKPIDATKLGILVGELYKQFSASNLVKTGEGILAGIFVSSSSGATVQIYDSLTASGALMIDTFTPVAGIWIPIPVHFLTGCYIVVTGTASITAVFD